MGFGKIFRFLIYLCGFCLLYWPCYGGAWPVPKGKGLVIATTLYDRANKAFDENGKLDLSVDFSKWEENLFLEYGLSNKTTLVLQTSLQDIDYFETLMSASEVEFTGIGESYLGIRHLLWKSDNSLLSFQSGILFSGGGEFIADADLGLGATSFEARVLYGRGFQLSDHDGFLDLQIARRFRAREFPSEWRLEASSGVDIHKKAQFILQGFYVSAEQKYGFARKNERLKVQPSFVYKKSDKTSWQFGVFQTVYGKNIIKEQGGFFSIWTRY